MQRDKLKKYEAWAEILKALSSPIRLFIVEELENGKKNVSDFNDLLHIDISTISRHLSILKKAGIIESEKKGTQVFYSLKIPCVTHFLVCSNNVLKEKINEQGKLIE